MAAKSMFSAEEWSAIRDTPNFVALATALAGSSGIFGTIGEMFTAAKTVFEGTTGSNELIREAAAREEIEASKDAVKAAMEGAASPDAARMALQDAAISKVQQSLAIVRAKAPDSAMAYTSWLTSIGQKVAESSTEGGFLGFGGVRVSDGEKAFLSRLASVTSMGASAGAAS